MAAGSWTSEHDTRPGQVPFEVFHYNCPLQMQMHLKEVSQAMTAICLKRWQINIGRQTGLLLLCDLVSENCKVQSRTAFYWPENSF